MKSTNQRMAAAYDYSFRVIFSVSVMILLVFVSRSELCAFSTTMGEKCLENYGFAVVESVCAR